jgi:hypothetical protein
LLALLLQGQWRDTAEIIPATTHREHSCVTGLP